MGTATAAKDRTATDSEGETVRYLMISKATDSTPDEKLYAAMGEFIQELTAAGVLLATGGLDPGAIRVVSSGDEITVTDGPFAEAKEDAAGFALVEVRSEEEAIELTRRFRKIVGDGESVIRRVN